MSAWYWICDVNEYPKLWDEWRARNVASLGWPPEWIAGNPQRTRALQTHVANVRRMTEGDRIVAYLKGWGIGGLGTFRRILHLDDTSWSPIADGDHGRLAEVHWDTLPDAGLFSLTPEGLPRGRLRTVYRITRPEDLRALEETIRSPDSWSPLPDSARLFEKECSEVHEAILANLPSIEAGMEPGPWKPPHEHRAGPIGIIDLLVQDGAGAAVVIEAKTEMADDVVMDQLTRYMGWVRLRLDPRPKEVRGIIIAGGYTSKTRFAASAVPNVGLYSYGKTDGGSVDFRRVLTKGEETMRNQVHT